MNLGTKNIHATYPLGGTPLHAFEMGKDLGITDLVIACNVNVQLTNLPEYISFIKKGIYL